MCSNINKLLLKATYQLTHCISVDEKQHTSNDCRPKQMWKLKKKFLPETILSYYDILQLAN